MGRSYAQTKKIVEDMSRLFRLHGRKLEHVYGGITQVHEKNKNTLKLRPHGRPIVWDLENKFRVYAYVEVLRLSKDITIGEAIKQLSSKGLQIEKSEEYWPDSISGILHVYPSSHVIKKIYFALNSKVSASKKVHAYIKRRIKIEHHISKNDVSRIRAWFETESASRQARIIHAYKKRLPPWPVKDCDNLFFDDWMSVPPIFAATGPLDYELWKKVMAELWPRQEA